MGKNEIVLVTGGSGYIAAYIMDQLLKQGYSVRTTVRSLKREEEVRAALRELGQTADMKLQIYQKMQAGMQPQQMQNISCMSHLHFRLLCQKKKTT